MKLKELGGEFVLDIIDVSRKNNGLVQKAVEYFVSDKIVCKDFDTVIKLQREGQSCKNIVTLDGIEYKQGMISGGTHSQNLFNINLGSYELDKDIKKLTDQIKRLSDKLDSQKFANKDNLSKENKFRREVDNTEIEIERLKQTKESVEKQIKERKLKVTDLESQLKKTLKDIEDVNHTIQEFNGKIQELRDDLKVVEKDAFKQFCSKLKVKDIAEYEKQINGDDSSILDKKSDLNQLIQKK